MKPAPGRLQTGDCAAFDGSCRADICSPGRRGLDQGQSVLAAAVPLISAAQWCSSELPRERKMRIGVLAACSLLLLGHCLERPALAQVAGDQTPQIAWEVKSRLRLFPDERGFERQLPAHPGDVGLAAEEPHARRSD